MEFYEVLAKRRSIRKYKSDPVEEDKINRILEAARIAPSAANRQPWHFLVIKDAAVKSRLREAYSPEWFHTAPVIVCVCGEPDKAWVRGDGKNYVDVDVATPVDVDIGVLVDVGIAVDVGVVVRVAVDVGIAIGGGVALGSGVALGTGVAIGAGAHIVARATTALDVAGVGRHRH